MISQFHIHNKVIVKVPFEIIVDFTDGQSIWKLDAATTLEFKAWLEI